jgi:N-acetylmuramoyl-L-alanine amidase
MLAITFSANAQGGDKPFIKLVEPTKEKNTVKSSRQFLIGSTCKTCSLSVNGQAVKVYATGGFAYELNVLPGDTSFIMNAAIGSNDGISKTILYHYTPPPVADTVKTLQVTQIETFPAGNLYVAQGDRIGFKVKALSGCTVRVNNRIPLYEIPTSKGHTMPGIYQGEYIIQANDSFQISKWLISISDKSGASSSALSKTGYPCTVPICPILLLPKEDWHIYYMVWVKTDWVGLK